MKQRCQGCVSTLESHILTGLAQGKSLRQIGERLYKSEHTVAYHVEKMEKMVGALNRAALVAASFISGVLSSDSWPIRPTGDTHLCSRKRHGCMPES